MPDGVAEAGWRSGLAGSATVNVQLSVGKCHKNTPSAEGHLPLAGPNRRAQINECQQGAAVPWAP